MHSTCSARQVNLGEAIASLTETNERFAIVVSSSRPFEALYDLFKNPKNEESQSALHAVEKAVGFWNSSSFETRSYVNEFVNEGCARALKKLTKDLAVLMRGKSDGSLEDDHILPLTNRDLERIFGML